MKRGGLHTMKVTKFDLVLNVWVSFVICAVMSYMFPIFTTGHITAGEFFSGLGVSMIISYALVTIFPIAPLGDRFAAKCRAKPHTFARQLLTTVVLSLIMSVVMSIFMTWWGLHNVQGFQAFFWSAWAHTYPLALLIIYFCANVGLSTGIPMTMKILHVPSGKSQAGNL